MSYATRIELSKLKLDLDNYRTVHQRTETGAIRALISINPDWFWALADSLLDDGYLPTENIIILEHPKGSYEVREGNRRIAILKLACGLHRCSSFVVPESIEEKIADLTPAWKSENSKVPCAVFSAAERDAVSRIVNLAHGKGQQAGRDKWNAIARARHNRGENGASEPALDLLEKYLVKGANLTAQQKERWAGDYPLSVLDDAIKRTAQLFGAESTRALANAYPSRTKHTAKLETILLDIGNCKLTHAGTRKPDFALTEYGIPGTSSAAGKSKSGSHTATGTQTSKGTTTTSGTSAKPNMAAANRAARSLSITDPKSLARVLKQFTPVGKHREKLVLLLDEARQIKVDKTPLAFCFLLRSMFEISAKAYCLDHASTGGPSAVKSGGAEDRLLVEVLRDVANHLTKNQTDKQVKKALHGATAELARSDGFLSVTSMNQLIHHTGFSVDDSHICTLFHNIFPLLSAMNQ